jgi:hypothetical protein
MPGRPFIGSEGERGGQASERNRRRRLCITMAMKTTVLKGIGRGVMRGGALAIMGAEGGRAPGGSSAREPSAAASWLSSRRRKMKGWDPRVSEGEGRAGPS